MLIPALATALVTTLVPGHFDQPQDGFAHQWTTLRNLADLLRRLGDEHTAAQLDAAADGAPDAPARGSPHGDGRHPSGAPVLTRDAVLQVARQAIERYLTRS